MKKRFHARLVALVACGAMALGAASALAQDATQPANSVAGRVDEETNGRPGHEAGEGEHAPEPINWYTFGGTHPDAEHPGQTRANPPPFVASLFNFMLLVAVLYYAVKKTVNPALADRRKAAESEIAEAHRLKAEAESLHKAYSEKLAKLDDELAAIRDEFQKSGRADAERVVREATARAERMQLEGQQMIEHEVRELRTDLQRQAVEAAVASAEGAVKRSIGAQDQARLADEYLTDLEKSPRDGALSS